ncbi:MAG: hypothetical protein ACTSW2_08850 [Alphaproteobacteria bacterium]
MKKRTGFLLAAAVGLTVLAGPVQAQDSGSVVIYRGSQAETVRFDNRSGVTVVRGQPAVKPVAPVRPYAHSKIRRVSAGGTLWIVDGGAKRLVACRLQNTTQVGGRRIRCTERSLPAALR